MLLTRIRRTFGRFCSPSEEITRIREALGRIEARQVAARTDPRQEEFRVFSQWRKGGIIQYMVRHVPIERPIVVEFDVENYVESNMRFLLPDVAPQI